MTIAFGGLKGWSGGKWMVTRKTPPEQGLSDGPIIVACQWNMSSVTGPWRFSQIS